jgi:hypothetical protein
MKPRSWVVLPSLRAVLIGMQVVLAVMALAGAACLVVGGKALVDSWRFTGRARAANAVVVDVAEVVRRVQRRSGDNWYDADVTYYHPVFRFATAHDPAVQVRASEGSEDPLAYRVGESVRILYDPANPRDARLDTWFSRWGDGVVLGSIGLGLVLLAALGFLLLIWPRLRAARGGRGS